MSASRHRRRIRSPFVFGIFAGISRSQWKRSSDRDIVARKPLHIPRRLVIAARAISGRAIYAFDVMFRYVASARERNASRDGDRGER